MCVSGYAKPKKVQRLAKACEAEKNKHCKGGKALRKCFEALNSSVIAVPKR